mgnify:CR=1 FL=1
MCMENENCLHEFFNHTHTGKKGFCAVECANIKCGKIFSLTLCEQED